jgi:hypothetical protein
MAILISSGFPLNAGSAIDYDHVSLLHHRAALVGDGADNRPIQDLSVKDGQQQNVLNAHNRKAEKS